MTIRLNKVTRDLNVGIATVVEFLQKKGHTVEANPNTKISEEQYAILVKEFSTDKNLRLESERFIQERQNKERNKASVSIEGFEKQPEKPKSEDVIKTVVPEDARPKFKPVGKIDLDKLNGRKPEKVEKEPEQKQEEPVVERPVVKPEVKKEPEKREPEVKKEEVVTPPVSVVEPTPVVVEPVVVPEPVVETKPVEVEKVVEAVKKEVSGGFIKVIFKLGFLQASGKYCFWKMIFLIIRNYLSKLVLAITLAVYGFNFRKIAELL